MSQDRLSPIPTPPEQYWRQFRQKGLPGLAFLVVLCLSVWLWGANLANPLVMGQAESTRADLLSPSDGEVVDLRVRQYDFVQPGDVIAVVQPSTPEILSNTLAVIQAEMDEIRAEGGFDAGDRVRFHQFQVEWLQLRGELTALCADLEYAQAELERIQKLHADGIVEQSELDAARRDVKSFEAQIVEKERAVATAEAALQGLNPAVGDGTAEQVEAAVKVATQRFNLAQSELRPRILRAPIGGQLSALAVANNSIVTRGQVLATVANPKVEKIVGYIPQPIRVEPRIGMPVEIRSRGSDRVVARSAVAEIGPRIELFDAPLRIRGMGSAQERGLPIVVSVPEQMQLRPGELVELRLITD